MAAFRARAPLLILVISCLAINATVTATPDYRDALSKALLFFDGQRSGNLSGAAVKTRTTWRGDSGLTDGKAQKVDLLGGYYDGAGNVKYGLPLAFSLTLLSWAAVDYQSQLAASGGQLSAARDTIRWGTDYLLKAHTSANELWVQVGDGPSDDLCWQRPEDMTTDRTAYRVNATRPGSDVAGETAAAMAAASLVFAKVDPSYSSLLLNRSQQLFTFADTYRGVYSDSIPIARRNYPSWTGYEDELAWAAAWLHRATGSSQYLEYLAVNDEQLQGSTQSTTDSSAPASASAPPSPRPSTPTSLNPPVSPSSRPSIPPSLHPPVPPSPRPSIPPSLHPPIPPSPRPSTPPSLHPPVPPSPHPSLRLVSPQVAQEGSSSGAEPEHGGTAGGGGVALQGSGAANLSVAAQAVVEGYRTDSCPTHSRPSFPPSVSTQVALQGSGAANLSVAAQAVVEGYRTDSCPTHSRPSFPPSVSTQVALQGSGAANLSVAAQAVVEGYRTDSCPTHSRPSFPPSVSTQVALQGSGAANLSVAAQAVVEGYRGMADAFACAYMPDNPLHSIYVTPGGLVYVRARNSQYATSAAFLLLLYSDYLASANQTLSCDGTDYTPADMAAFSKSQMDYLLGVNPLNASYMVGFGQSYPQKLRHRAASIVSFKADSTPVTCEGGKADWLMSPDPNPNVHVGAIVGGADA
ncbi:unnamed protein product, partial [Closterium sp. Yama58-4]